MKLKIGVTKHLFMCLLLGLSLSGNAQGAPATEDFSVTPVSLNFGSVPNTQAKSLTFKAESRKVADYTVTVTAPFTVSPASGHFGVIGAAVGTAEDKITVSLPANLPPGTKSGTLTVEFRPKFPLGNVIKVKKTISLSAIVTDPNAPTGFDLSTTLENANAGITQTIRHVSIKINAKVQGGNTAAYKTRMMVSVDGAAEIEVYNGLIVYVPNATQAFVLAHDIPVSARTIKFRIITDPDNTVVEINENNNTQTLTRTFN
jgi:hypothetical protein